MPGCPERVRRGRAKDSRGIGVNSASVPSVKEVIGDLANALRKGDFKAVNDALGKFLELALAEAEKSVLSATGSIEDSRVDEVGDGAVTRRTVGLFAMLRSVSEKGGQIPDPEKTAASFVYNALAEIWGFKKKNGQKVPPLVYRLEAKRRRRREQSLDEPIAGKTAEEGAPTFADVCEDKKSPPPYQVSVWLEELTQWHEVAATHASRSLREILPKLLELWGDCGLEICPLPLFEMRPIEPPSVDEKLLEYMQKRLPKENVESLAERVREIKPFLARCDLIEAQGVAEELRRRIDEFVSFAHDAPASLCTSRHRETMSIVADYLQTTLANLDHQPDSAANVILPSLLHEYKCRVNPDVVNHLEQLTDSERDTLQKCLKRHREILLSDPSSVLRRSKPR